MIIRRYPATKIPPRLLLLRGLGYAIFTKKDYDLNLIGIRSRNRTPGRFDDKFVCIYRENNEFIEEEYICTTDPSMEEHLDPTNKKGVAILAPGQYRSAYELDLHRGKYTALCQRGTVTVYRDNNMNSISDYINSESGLYGINVHRAHSSKIVESTHLYSMGCTVIQNPASFARLIALCKLQVGIGYKKFTYTLIEE